MQSNFKPQLEKSTAKDQKDEKETTTSKVTHDMHEQDNSNVNTKDTIKVDTEDHETKKESEVVEDKKLVEDQQPKQPTTRSISSTNLKIGFQQPCRTIQHKEVTLETKNQFELLQEKEEQN